MQEEQKSMQTYESGIPVYKGYGIGSIYVLGSKDNILNAKPEEPDDLESHLDHLIQEALKQFRAAKRAIGLETKNIDFQGELPPDYVIDICISALEKPSRLKSHILLASGSETKKTLHDALGAGYHEFAQDKTTEAIADIYLRLMSINCGIKYEDVSDLKKGQIVVTGPVGITASVEIMEKKPAGIASSDSEDSHLAMLARENGIPFIARAGGVVATVIKNPKEYQSRQAVVDSYGAKTIVHPDQETFEKYKRLQKCESDRQEDLKKRALEPCVTLDGHYVTILGNRNNLDFADASRLPVDGLGLVRLETIYATHATKGIPLDAGHLSQIFTDASLHLSPDRPVTVRLLDVNDQDKTVDDLFAGYQRDGITRFDEQGNALKGLSFLLENQSLMEIQTEALIRLNTKHPAKILLPYVQNFDELKATKKIIDSVFEEMQKGDEILIDQPRVCSMVETTQLTRNKKELEKVIKASDEISIGGNDLSNEEAGVDRYRQTKVKKAEIPPIYHPKFIRSIIEISDLCKKHNKPCSMCGDCASDPEFLPILLALEIKPVVLTNMTFEVRERAKLLKFSDCQEIFEEIKKLKTPKAIRDKLQKFSASFASNCDVELQQTQPGQEPT